MRRLFGWGYWSGMDEEVVWMGILECLGVGDGIGSVESGKNVVLEGSS